MLWQRAESYSADSGIYDESLATERIAAAVETSHKSPSPLVLTAHAENHLRGQSDLANTISHCRPTRKRARTSSTPGGSRTSARSAASRLRSTAP